MINRKMYKPLKTKLLNKKPLNKRSSIIAAVSETLANSLRLSISASVTVLLCGALLTACVGKPAPETQYYLLRMEDTPVEELPVSKISLTSLEVAPYLKQTGLIMDRGDGQIIPARYHQWSEPLDFSIQNFLQRSLSVLYGEEFLDHRGFAGTGSLNSPMSMSIHIDQLHGAVDGTVKLVASWTLRKGPQAVGNSAELQHHRFVETETLQEDGYLALVNAHRELLQKLSVAIVKSLPRDVNQPITSPRAPRETVF